MNREIKTPLTKEMAKELRAGDYVTITGTIYTARDAAHKRMIEALDAGEKLPIEIDGNILYYMGPSPAREGRPIGSAGPTTASRMDKYAPRLLDLGLIGMIAKVTIVLYECRYQVRTLTNQIGYYEGTVRVAHANDLILIYIVICDEVIQNTSYFLRCYYFTCVVNIHTQDNCFRICFCPAGHHVIK